MNIWLERLFLLLIFSLGFMQPSLDYAGMKLPVTDLVYSALAVVFLLAVALRHSTIEWDRSYLFIGAFGLAMALSTVLSAHPRTSTIKFVGILYLMGLAIFAINIVTSPEAIRRVILVWLTASTVVALIAAVTVLLFYLDRGSPWHELFLHHYGSLPVGNYPRIQSTFLYPAMLCNYLSVGVLILLGAQRAGWVNTKLAAGILFLHLIAAAFTLTPGLGGFAAALALWGGWLFFDRGRTGPGVCSATAGFVVLVLFTLIAAFSVWPIDTSPYIYQFLGIRLDPTQRMLTWQAALNTFAHNPLFGKGIGLGVVSVLFRAPSGQMQMLTDAHNTWLSVAAQSGIIGLTAVLALSAHVLRRAWNSIAPRADFEWIRLSLLTAFIGSFVLQGLVGSFEDARHLWVLMGLMIALDRVVEAEGLS